MRRALIALSLVCTVVAPRVLTSQERGATALKELVAGLPMTARVLVIGAHPDDEDTQLISFLSRGRHVETAYLSLTRGDGGQNLIGNELGEALGVVRTEELLAARRIDGARQYFTRAYDFGFSKSAEETLTHWPKDSLLRDVIAVVRSFRPHVIVSVFSGTPNDGHGQHQVAGILAREAYVLAADPTKFPSGVTGDVKSWQALKFYRSARFSPDASTLRFNVGEYSPLLGRSYAEIAGESRSQHKSQAFGTLQRKGVVWDYVRLEASNVTAPEDAKRERSIFDGIDTTWARVRTSSPRVDALKALIDTATRLVDGDDRLAAPSLARLAANARALEESVRCIESLCPQAEGDLVASIRTLRDRASRAALIAAGVTVEATVDRELYALEDTVSIAVAVYNRGRDPVWVAPGGGLAGPDLVTTRDGIVATAIAPDSVARFSVTARARRHTYPSWLASPRRGDLFASVENDWNDATRLRLSVRIGNDPVDLTAPVVHRFADPVRGEVQRPVAVVNRVSILLERATEYVPAGTPFGRVVRVELKSGANAEQRVRIDVGAPNGIRVAPLADVVLPAFGRRTVDIRLGGQLPEGSHTLIVVGQSGGLGYTHGYVDVDYEHIRPQRIYRPAELTLRATDVIVPRVAVGYISGVGDNVFPALRELGVNVSAIDPATLATVDLSRFGTIVIGPRAYESSPQLVAANARLLDYVRDGGRLLVQYGQYEMMQSGIMPYPITIARPSDRVTEENARVTMLPGALLRVPNRITERDWSGWVQERSLYMPRDFDSHFVPALEMHDRGEPPNRGALLVARYGKGTYVYTTLALFRQLPAGVPGAARLFMNMLVAVAGAPVSTSATP